MRVLVLNPGSSSVKLALVEESERVREQTVESVDEVDEAVAAWPEAEAVGVRFVHGGPRHLTPMRVDAQVLEDLDEAAPLAPLHDPPALALAHRYLAAGAAPVVACFDTTYHADLPAAAATYALPQEWNRRFSLRRYGFHGLSHQHAARRAALLLGRDHLRVVSCHLGGGASVCASVGGRSVDTTMGFTPLEGLVMQRRSGSVDPGLLLWLLQHGGIEVDELAETLEHRSGISGLAGTSGDVREVLDRAESGDGHARLAIDVYVHQLRRHVGAMAASAGGMDALVLTGGVGENSTEIRRQLADGLGHLGVGLAEHADSQPDDTDEHDISAADAACRTLVVPAREDLVIAEQVEALFGAGTAERQK